MTERLEQEVTAAAAGAKRELDTTTGTAPATDAAATTSVKEPEVPASNKRARFDDSSKSSKSKVERRSGSDVIDVVPVDETRNLLPAMLPTLPLLRRR